MIIKKLVLAAAFAVTAFSAQAASVHSVEVVAGSPTINDTASGFFGPSVIVAGPGGPVTVLGDGFSASSSNLPVSDTLITTTNFLGLTNQFLANFGPFSSQPLGAPALIGDFIDATDGVGFIQALFETNSGSLSGDFGPFFRLTLSNSLFTDTSLDTGGSFFGPTTILVEGVQEIAAIPLPAGLVLMLTGLAGFGVVRRRSNKPA